jgi:hypothetical protein
MMHTTLSATRGHVLRRAVVTGPSGSPNLGAHGCHDSGVPPAVQPLVFRHPFGSGEGRDPIGITYDRSGIGPEVCMGARDERGDDGHR